MNDVTRLATGEDLPAAAATLAAAFMEYPWTRWVIPPDDYPDRLRTLQGLYLAHAYHHGVVAVHGEADGVIALLPPDAPEPDGAVVEQIVALHGDRVTRLGTTPPSSTAWRLETLGVRPEARGRGLGGVLVRFALQEIASRGAREVVLETSDRRNVRLYERHGFEVTGQAQAGDGPPTWTMRTGLVTDS